MRRFSLSTCKILVRAGDVHFEHVLTHTVTAAAAAAHVTAVRVTVDVYLVSFSE